MQEIEVLINCLSTLHILKSGNSIVLVHSHKIMFENLLDAFLDALVVERFIKLIAWREHHRWCTVILDLSIVSDSILPESSLAQIQDLLGSSSAFDWEHRACEHGIATTEAFSQDRRLVCSIKGIHGADWRLSILDCFLSTSDFIESQLETRVHHKNVICGP